jgi:hypothetical protein
MNPKRLVLFVEGQGDVQAAPILLNRLLSEYGAFDVVFSDPDPFRVGEYSRISKDGFAHWRRFLQAASRRASFGGCLLLLDGDSQAKVQGLPFCAMRAARLLAAEAQVVGAGRLFSVAVVFACMEFESWLIAGVNSLLGRRFSDGRKELPEAIEKIPPDPEAAPRDAKGWFGRIMETGYRPARDQTELTRLVDINLIRKQDMRSFRRLESAVKQLVEAIRSGKHVVTPEHVS